MPIMIQNLIIHQIDKTQPLLGQKKQNATLIKATSLTQTSPNDDWHQLVEKALKSTNEDRRLRRGRFTPSMGFKDEYEQYAKSNISFIQLSELTIDRLAQEMNKSTMATGGFILFADIIENNTSYFYCIMFKEKIGDNLQYNKSTGRFELKGVVFLDLEKMHQGFCLEIADYNTHKANGTLFNDDQKPYLFFINMQKSDKTTTTSEYFIDTFGCRVSQNSAKSMDILLNKTIHLFESDAKLQKYANTIHNDVENYYKKCHASKNDIELSKVEQIINSYTAKEQFSPQDQKKVIDGWFDDLVHDKVQPISAVFVVNEDQLKKYGTINLTVDGYKLVGQKDKLLASTSSDEVYYDQQKLQIIITLPTPIV